MNDKALRILEFHKIIDMLTEHATSELGRAMCKSLRPSVILSTIEQTQMETEHALQRILKKGSTNFGNNKPLGMSIKSLDIGSVLSVSELLKIAMLLENVARVKAYGRDDKASENGQYDSLAEYFNGLEPLTPLSAEIRRCIISEEEIADDASSNLKRIRREIGHTHDKIHSQLNSMVNGSYRT